MCWGDETVTKQVYKIIDDIDSSKLKERLDTIKEYIRNDENAKKLIKRFEKAKENYEKYNLKEEFITAKKDLLNNNMLKEYIKLQKSINLLTLQINNRINKITKGITDKR